jgi:hypothetical protein
MALIFLLYPLVLSSLEVVRAVLARGHRETEVLIFDLVPFAEAQTQFEHSSEVVELMLGVVFACAWVSEAWSLVLLEQLRSRRTWLRLSQPLDVFSCWGILRVFV